MDFLRTCHPVRIAHEKKYVCCMRIFANDVSRIGVMGSDIKCSGNRLWFTAPGTCIAFSVTGANCVSMEIACGFNIFCVSVHDTDNGNRYESTVTSGNEVNWIQVCHGLLERHTYVIHVIKKTEPFLRTALTRFYPAKLRSISCENGKFLPINPKEHLYPKGWIEVIGDSDACGFGVAGPISSPHNFLSMDPVAEDVRKGWGCLLAEALGLGPWAVVMIAASGRGIIRNAPFCGTETVPELWRQSKVKHGSRVQPSELPRAVVLLVGGNDFYDLQGPCSVEFTKEFSRFICEIRSFYGSQVPIFLFQCSASCLSSAGSASVHPQLDEPAVRASERLCGMTEAVTKTAGSSEASIYFHVLRTRLIHPVDYSIMMHWSESGQRKIASEMAQFITDQNASDLNKLI